MCDLGRARKDVCPFTQEKNRGRVQQIEKSNDFRSSSTWNERFVICFCSREDTLMWHNVSQRALLCKRHHTHNFVFFLFVLFSLIVLQLVSIL